jgi:hypothetical protein
MRIDLTARSSGRVEAWSLCVYRRALQATVSAPLNANVGRHDRTARPRLAALATTALFPSLTSPGARTGADSALTPSPVRPVPDRQTAAEPWQAPVARSSIARLSPRRCSALRLPDDLDLEVFVRHDPTRQRDTLRLILLGDVGAAHGPALVPSPPADCDPAHAAASAQTPRRDRLASEASECDEHRFGRTAGIFLAGLRDAHRAAGGCRQGSRARGESRVRYRPSGTLRSAVRCDRKFPARAPLRSR